MSLSVFIFNKKGLQSLHFNDIKTVIINQDNFAACDSSQYFKQTLRHLVSIQKKFTVLSAQHNCWDHDNCYFNLKETNVT